MRLYALKKHGRINWRDIYRAPAAIVLYALTWLNYEQRFKRIKPDEWYWADEVLFCWGYAVKRM